MGLIKSGEPAGRNWLAINRAGEMAAAAGRTLTDHALRVRRLERPAQMGKTGWHPFRIYQYPRRYRATDDESKDWRRFRVRGGRVFESEAEGTDGALYPDLEIYPDLPDGEILVPAGKAQYWFWLEIGSTSGGVTTAVVRYGDDPTTDDYDGGGETGQAWESTNPWSAYPKPDGAHVPIGWVDTDTDEDNKVARVRQLLRGDVGSAGGTVEIQVCNPDLGIEETYLLVGSKKVTPPS